jgi:hypothetical protein
MAAENMVNLGQALINGQDRPLYTALGQWEDEGELSEFVSIGLKCYGMRYANGAEAPCKIKGSEPYSYSPTFI